MKELSYFLAKVRYRLSGRNKEIISKYFRKMGMKIGENCNIVTNIATTEGYLVSIGNNVTLSAGVVLITHDNSISKVLPNTTDLFGRINIGNNCFIGNRAMILYGVTLADNIIVAAGSVVTKSFTENGIIIGGNPAKKIGTWDAFAEKYSEKALNLDIISADELQSKISCDATLISK
jgi:acetyltransferase-like isoleucine patch superfamily enzyme